MLTQINNAICLKDKSFIIDLEEMGHIFEFATKTGRMI